MKNLALNAHSWPILPLSEVLRHRKEFIQIDDSTNYKRCRVQLHAQGIVLRDQVLGSEIRTKKQQVCRAGEFLVAEIDAKHGGFGLVPPELDGALVSSHYFLFEVDSTRLDRRFLGWYCRTREFQEQVSAQGSTNYAAIRPTHVLAYTIPLPPLNEQHRIVARIEALNSRVNEIRVLMKDSDHERDMLWVAWAMSELEKLSSPCMSLGGFIADGGYGTSVKCEYVRDIGMMPVLRIPNVVAEAIDTTDMKFGRLAADDMEQLSLSAGDILLVRTNGSADLVGRAAVVDESAVGMAFASYLIRLRMNQEAILPEYAHLLLRHARLRGLLFDKANTSAGQYNVSLGRLRTLQVPVPSFNVQERLVKTSKELTRRILRVGVECGQASELVDVLPAAILGKAFRGEM